jgi:Rap1a immunity proteins
MLLALSSPAVAQGITGNELLSDCEQLLKNMRMEGDRVFFRGDPESRCWGFMEASQEFSDEGFLGCLPPEGTLLQLIRVFVSYGEQHPEKLRVQANHLVIDAFKQAFPCPLQPR